MTMMFMLLILQLLLLQLIRIQCLIIKEEYTGLIQRDNIVYNVIVIPRHAKYVRIDIWANKFETPPFVFFKYDGLPTIRDYDDIFELPESPLELSLVDGAPTEALLYIGIWGGALLHSYRYFAGSAIDVVYGIESTIESCDDQMMYGDNCIMLDKLESSIHGSISNFTLNLDSSRTFALNIPNGLEDVSIQVSLDNDELKSLCYMYLNTINENIDKSVITELIAYVYLGQIDEDLDGGKQHFPISLDNLCNNNRFADLGNKPVINLNLMLPIAGTWKVTILLFKSSIQSDFSNNDNNYKSRRWLRLNSKIEDIKNNKSHIFEQKYVQHQTMIESLKLSVNVTFFTCNANYMGINDKYEIYNHTEYTNTSINLQITSRLEDKRIESNCVMKVNPMLSIRTSESSSQGYLTLKSDYVNLGKVWVEETVKINNYSDITQTIKSQIIYKDKDLLSLPYTVFAARMDHAMIPPIGGGLQIQLYIKPNISTNDDILKVMGKLHFRLSLRFGALPIDPDMEKLDTATLMAMKNDGKIIPSNGITLSTRDAIIRQLKNDNYKDYDDDDDTKNIDEIDEILYVWTLMKPRLPGVSFSSGSNNYLYARVMLGHSDLNTSTYSFNIATTMTFEPCPTGVCSHGTCENQQGDVAASSCDCKFPWAGESCSELGIPYWFFVIQISCLVLSNLAMLPGILFAYFHHMPLFSILLSSSATSSALYHLCDTDVWCMGGLSFKSLQIYDILFSTVSVASVIMHHSPWSSDTHSALVICIFSILISPISNDPTDPFNIIIALTFSIIVCILAWISSVIAHRFPYLGSVKRNHTWRSNPGMKSSTPLSSRISAATSGYAPVANNDSKFTNDNIEMKLFNDKDTSSFDDEIIGFDNESESDDGHEVETSRENLGEWRVVSMNSATLLERITAIIKSIPATVYLLRWSFLGLLLSLLGILCFSLQTRLTYWYMHSLWHLLVMSSVLPSLFGRGICVNYIASKLYLPIRGNAILQRPGF